MKHFPILYLLLANVASVFAESSVVNAATTLPNILFIYADDWGWGDLASHGHPHLKTPNLDRLAREGTDFHQFTVCNPVCSPSRVAIVTGQYPARHRIHYAIGGHAMNASYEMPDWLDPKVTLLPRLLKEAGYTTGHFGKWHLGGAPNQAAPMPAEYGYDADATWTGAGRDAKDTSSFRDKKGNTADPLGACYHTAAAVEHTIKFIREAKERPFYINLWILETHHLVAATDEDKKAYPDTAEPQRTYYSAVTRADRLIGSVLDTLDELGLAKNTLVIFSSDNGPEVSEPNAGDQLYHSVGSTGGLRGRKRSLYMGGVNVPFIVRWPGHVPAGRVDKTSVLSGVDMLPTLCAAAGVALPASYQPDGINALPMLLGEKITRTQPIFWEWRGNHAGPVNWPELAMRDGDWGLVMTESGKRVELYDLAKDRAQETNLAAAQPERVATMTQQLRAWKATLPPTAPQRPGGGGRILTPASMKPAAK